MLEERYRQAVSAFNERDLDAWIGLMDEQVDIESRFSRFGQNYFRGHRAMRRWWDDLADAWELIRVEPDEVREVAPDQTLALIKLRAKGRESGVEVLEPTAHRVDWRDGRWIRLRYEDRAVAERELGDAR
jgi:ketosteroid isomerase-like protein